MDNIEEDYLPKVGICGLINNGNTCYMNSILQLLLHNKLLMSFILNTKIYEDKDNSTNFDYYLFQGSVQRVGDMERKRLKLKEDDVVTLNKQDIDKYESLALIGKFSEIAKIILNRGNSAISPTSFKTIIDYKLPLFRGYSQHDAHELLIQVLDIFIEETGIESEPVINNVHSTIKDYINYYEEIRNEIINTNLIEERKEIISKLNNYKKNNEKIINQYNGIKYIKNVFKSRYNPFIFKLKTFLINTITCSNCKNETYNYEDTTVLTLQVKNTLIECFENLVYIENIEDYNCSICNQKNIACKKTQILRPGITLFLHFKRFIVMPNGRILKDNNTVEIPHEIDITNYCDNSMKNFNNLTYKYKLKGISNHFGNMGGGHYTADCVCMIDNKSWYNFNDASVSKYDNDNINTSNAYILMYEMII